MFTGGVGSFAVQMAKGMGARVTGVCSSRNVSLVRDQLGADEVIDYTTEDVTGTYDRILDLVGNRTPSNWRRLLKADGALVAAAGHTCCCNKIGLTTGVVGGRDCVSDGLMKKGKPWL